ncbi:MAG TPA: glycosyltransferase family 4 protein [Rhizomicrobium sp.]
MNPSALILLRHFLPGYRFGGQLRSVRNIVSALCEDFEIRIGCLDRDQGDTAPYPGVALGEPVRVAGAMVNYLPPGAGLAMRIVRLLRQAPYDTLYINGFFDPVFSILPVFAIWLGLAPRRRVVIAPRGEFGAGALGLKAAKKKTFLWVSKLLGLHKGVVWQATSADEADRIRLVVGVTPQAVRLVGVLPALAPLDPNLLQRGRSNLLKLVFVSRICEMKNLTFALRVLSQVTTPVSFTIVGTAEDQPYWTECERLIGDMPPHIQVVYAGAVVPDAIMGVLCAQDVFFLPSLGENFGHVIFEALSAGLPIIVSDRTPWRSLEAAGVGFDLPLDRPQAFVAAIEHFAALGDAEFIAVRTWARSYAAQWMKAQDAVSGMRALLAGTN